MKGGRGKALFPSLCLCSPSRGSWVSSVDGGQVCQGSRPDGTPAPPAPAGDSLWLRAVHGPAASPLRWCRGCLTSPITRPTNLLNSVLCETPPAASAVPTGWMHFLFFTVVELAEHRNGFTYIFSHLTLPCSTRCRVSPFILFSPDTPCRVAGFFHINVDKLLFYSTSPRTLL